VAQKKWRDISRRFAATVGDGSATSIVLTHNLGTRDIVVSVRAAAGGFAALDSGWTWAATSVDTATLTFDVAPTAGQYRAVVVGA
jgi:hypothetical protein